MNILLTGGTGYIGSHTAVVLIEAGHRVVLFDNLSNSSRDVVDRLEQITHQKVPFVEGDVRDTVLVSRTLQDHQIDAVVHFAGLKAVGESVSDPLKYYDNNVVGTIKLLEAMQEAGIKKLVFSSSATVYGEPQYLPYDEDHPTKAINPYGRTKLHIEEMLHDFVNANPDWAVVCLRYFNPVGAHDSGLIGENPNGTPNNLVPYLVKVASGQLPKLNIFGSDYQTRDGTGERDYIHVMDLVEGHLSALSFADKNPGWYAINLGTGKSTSVLELVSVFERTVGLNVAYELVEKRPGDLPSFYAHALKAKILLGWEAKRSVDQMVKSAWFFEDLNPNPY